MIPNRSGFVQGVPPGGLDELDQNVGAATASDRGTLLQELWEAYLTCPWAFACVTAIARTVTASGLVMDWDGDTGEGVKAPVKPAAVLAMERLLAFVNPTQDVRQLCRNIVCDLLVFGDAFVEVVWLGRLPVALYNLDCPTTTPVTDEHGGVSKYVQVTMFGQRAEFKPHQVIHISLDSARPSVYGVSPTHAAQTSIISWLFFAACGKEAARRGLPPNIHADLPGTMADTEVSRWQQQYVTRNIGPQNVGTPVTTKGGGLVKELQTAKITDILEAKKEARDEIVSTYGVPPAKVGIIESGNLGGGTGSDQDKTFLLDTVWPIGELICEKLQFHIAVHGFGVQGWHTAFNRTDYRDDKVIEDIRDQRIRNGTWTINRARADAGEPGVAGGDVPVIIARQDIVAVSDIPAMSKAAIAQRLGPVGAAEPGALGGATGRVTGGGLGKLGSLGKMNQPGETARVVTSYLAARRALETPARVAVTEGSGGRAQAAVFRQLARSFPRDVLGWVKDARWAGPRMVRLSEVETSDRADWAASHDGPMVARLRAKLRRAVADGKHPRPVVLVKTPGNPELIVVDGHHHLLAALEEDREAVWAFTGRVKQGDDAWRSMHAAQKGGNR